MEKFGGEQFNFSFDPSGMAAARALEAPKVSGHNAEVAALTKRVEVLTGLYNSVKTAAAQESKEAAQERKKMGKETEDKFNDLYDKVAALERSLEDEKEVSRELRATIKQKTDDCAAKDTEIQNKAAQITEQKREIGVLKSQKGHYHKEYTQTQGELNNVNELLQTSYNDQKELKKQLKASQGETEKEQLAHHDTLLKLESLRKEWDDDQTKIAELESTHDAQNGFNEQYAALEHDVKSLQEQIEEAHHLLTAKDQRIGTLEQENQKNLLIARKAQAEAFATTPADLLHENTEPTFTPAPAPELPAPQGSLQAELDEASDNEFDTGSLGEATLLDFSDIQTSFDFEPLEPKPQAPILSISTISTTDIAPIERVYTTAEVQTNDPVTNSISIQTETPTFTISNISAAESSPIDPQKPAFTFSSIISSAETNPSEPAKPALTLSSISAVDTDPIEPFVEVEIPDIPEPKEPVTLGFSSLSTITTAPIEATPRETEPTTPPKTVIETSTNSTQTETPLTELVPPKIETKFIEVPSTKQTNWLHYLLPFIICLLIFTFSLWLRLQAWQNANMHTRGAYGRPGSFLGIPYGWSIGNGYYSEKLGAYWAGYLMRLEEYLGAHKSPLY